MPRPARFCLLLALCLGAACPQLAFAQTAASAPAAGELPLFVAEITVGRNWDAARSPQDQQHFREHSANLKRLRDAGALLIGGRYSDKGIIVLAAKGAAEARAMLDEDPSFKAEVFKYELHPFAVFYGGTIQNRQRRSMP